MASTMADQSLVSPVDPGPEDRSWWHVFRSWPAWARVPVYVAVLSAVRVVAYLAARRSSGTYCGE